MTTSAAFDAGPLAWVIGEVRDALASAGAALRDASERSIPAQPTLLLHAKTHLHQAHGALQMVDVHGVGLLTRGAEQALDRFKDGALACTAEHARPVIEAFDAIGEYLDELLAGAAPQPLRLFPYHRALQELLGAGRIHPSDLLVLDLDALALPPEQPAAPAPDYARCRLDFEKALLPYLKSASADEQRRHAHALQQAIAPVAAAQREADARRFWLAMHAFAELAAAAELDGDLYVKQLFGQINLQVRRLSQGQASQPEAMLRDALFFIAAAARPAGSALLLRQAWRLDGMVPHDYAERRYGRIAPAALKEAREALARAQAAWDRLDDENEAAPGGEVGPALAALAEAGARLGAPALARLLCDIERAAVCAALPAIEMAQALLLAGHGLDHVRQLPEDFGALAEAVGARLLALAAGEQPPAAPQWQGELARRIQQGQTVAALAGQVADGLRQVEKLLEAYHEDRATHDSLTRAGQVLHELHGALAMLDQEQAARAVQHVEQTVRTLADGTAGDPEAVLAAIARNVSALGFFTATLSRSGEAARDRFVFDDGQGLFREQALGQGVAQESPEAAAAAVVGEGDCAVEAELLEIFIAEAREVLGFVDETLPAAQADPACQDTLAMLRRSFHTLKGSSRMVGLERFAEAAFAIERVMNLWLSEARPASADLLALLAHARGELAHWVEALAAGATPAADGAALVAAAVRVQHGGAFVSDAGLAAEPEPDGESACESGSDPDPQSDRESESESEFRSATAPGFAPAPAAADDVIAPATTTLTPPRPAQGGRRVGTLEIALPLYNIYLAETDELVGSLERDFSGWRDEPARVVTAEALKAVHTLAGTSATVGFTALRDLACALETALETLAAPGPVLDDTSRGLLDVTLERIRDMLRQFALGELAPAQPELEAQLDALRGQLAARHVAPPDDAALARRLDTLFAATYDSLRADQTAQAEPPQADPEAAAVVHADAAQLPVDDPLAAATPHVHVHEARQRDTAATAAPRTDAFQATPEPHAAAEAPADAFESTPGLHVPVEAPVGAAQPPAEAADFAVAAAAAPSPGEPEAALATEPVFADELDPDLLPVFVEEASDLLPQAGNTLRQWQRDPADGEPAHQLLRILHTVKGSARMAGAMRLGQHVHALETQAGNMLHAGTTAPAAFDELVASFDQAMLLFEQLQAAPAAPAALADSPEPVPTDAQASAARSPQVRVRADVLDRLVNQAGEVSIARSRLENKVGSLKAALGEFSDNIARLSRQLREVEMQAETQIASRLSVAGVREFDPLEFDRFTRLQELTRMMAESVDDVASFQDSLARTVDSAGEDLAAQSRLTRELQRDLMRVRMVPFASLSERLFRVARQAAKETDKRVNLDIRGGATEIDRSVLEQMAAPFEHLLRNAIVHGIEPRAQRAAAGKPETGELLVRVSQQGNEVAIEFADDGVGLDLERIRAKARSTGLLAPDAVVPDHEAVELIFEPGFSTADALTELAGRGVGMDVVRSEAQALGGRVAVASDPGRGARFTIHLPLTLAVAQVVLASSGGTLRALPATLVEQVLQVKEADLALARQANVLAVQGQALPLHYLSSLLGEDGERPHGQRSSPVMVLRSGAERIALLVDEVVGNREVVVKNIGPQLARLAGLAGATVLGSGDIVLILNPLVLAQQAPAAAPAPRAPEPATAPRRRIMVVDDSITVRRVTQRLLEREGFEVMLAKDGLAALEQMQHALPDLMLVDIEMPRMDGFDLTRSVRGNERTRAIPVIMITSRTADKHRNYALGLGVDAYFGKPYQEPVLLAAIAGLLAGEPVT